MRPQVPLLLALSLSFSALAAPRVQVPRVATTPKIDGAAGTKEWKDAIRIPLGSEGRAMLQHNGTYLFIALVGRRNGIGSLCTMKGKEVHVLHASAALGTAAYALDGKVWKNTRTFEWTNRDTGPSPAAMEDRKKFLGAEGWFANTRPDASVQREFQIRIDGRGEIPLALGFLSMPQKGTFELVTWPERVDDSCGETELAAGNAEGDYVFDPKEEWGVAEIR